MAAAFAVSRPTETTTMSAVNDIPSGQLRLSTLRDDDTTQSDAHSPQSSRVNLPPPNPPFVFPNRPPSSAPSSFSRATGRRPQSVIEIHQRASDLTAETAESPSRPSALPDFSFNPGASAGPDAGRPSKSLALPDFSFNPGANLGPNDSLLSPLSPPSPRLPPVRNGHRRGGSEFVGGKLKAGGSITVMSTSPTRSESGISSPKLSPVDAHPKRGHAHRRSGAISSHDLTMILKPNNSATLRGSSAPTSPADFNENYRNFPGQKIEPPKLELPPQQVTQSVNQEVDLQLEPQSTPSPKTARVGFSEKLEFIPRPLSLISTDTSSTMTVRPGHRVSGSVSSIISTNAASSTDRDSTGLVGSPSSRAKNDSRPSTAGAVLERGPSVHVPNGDSSSRRRNSIPLLTQLPKMGSGLPTNGSPSKTPRRWSFFGLEPFVNAGSPTRTRPVSSSSNLADKNSESINPSEAPGHEVNVDGRLSRSESRRSSVRKKKQKKVKLWAGSILTRKSKLRSHKSKSARRRSQTPPVQQEQEMEDLDDSLLELSEMPIAPVVMVTEPQSDSPTILSTRAYEDDVSFPMIDLDAALGPFNTPSSRDPQWDEAQRAGAPPKRQLHSAAGLRGFSGPGMHYHRRAESAPEMPPFEAARFGIHRFGSSSTMADVFEEEEEEEDLSAKTPSEESSTGVQDASGDEVESRSSAEDDAASTPTQEREHSKISPIDVQATPASVTRKDSESSLDMQHPGSRIRIENSTSGLREEIIAEEPNHTAPSHALHILSTPDYSGSSAPSPRRIIHDEVDPVDVSSIAFPAASATPVTPYSMSYSSSFPSPRSPMSYDAHRISTAPSSIADESNYHSLLMGEPGPELVRISVDVPSLTSSNSTMTRDSTFLPGVQPRNMPFHDHRPASFSAAAFGRRRSSLVSLSRLISSAHGERSKLSMEVPCDSDQEEKPKLSKSKRFSRMVQFWKSKGPAKS